MSLKEAVLDQLGYRDDYDNEEIQGVLEDVCRSGADAGFGGFCYYADTVEFFNQNRDAIVKRAEELASDLGEDLLSLVGSFGCLSDRDAKFQLRRRFTSSEIGKVLFGPPSDEDYYTQIANGMAWFALEEVAREVTGG